MSILKTIKYLHAKETTGTSKLKTIKRLYLLLSVTVTVLLTSHA